MFNIWTFVGKHLEIWTKISPNININIVPHSSFWWTDSEELSKEAQPRRLYRDSCIKCWLSKQMISKVFWNISFKCRLVFEHWIHYENLHLSKWQIAPKTNWVHFMFNFSSEKSNELGKSADSPIQLVDSSSSSSSSSSSLSSSERVQWSTIEPVWSETEMPQVAAARLSNLSLSL